VLYLIDFASPRQHRKSPRQWQQRWLCLVDLSSLLVDARGPTNVAPCRRTKWPLRNGSWPTCCNHHHRNDTDDVAHHARNLDRYGITIVRNILQIDDEIERWKQRVVRRHCCTTTTATLTTPLHQDRHGGKYNKTGGAAAWQPSVPFHQELARLGGEQNKARGEVRLFRCKDSCEIAMAQSNSHQ
jgi:hypothetical protein